ncbi:hypothetical protein FIBSPDRAFT_1052018 [Athelia psychrophila]|uniref:Uncharacterized protein n=1 Tax=Athelia psychrophila TaxID=1759441 RepID=A0A165Y2D1_9AGAM|nr:hypothetical protein FIBSPDRAFT_1052018 [Fibularhizoctonia sp. CBS 109695]
MKLSSVAVFVSAVSPPNSRASSPRPSGRGATRTSTAREPIEGLVQGVTVPNIGLRGVEKRQCEDTPLEFIRLDFALAGARASADVTRSLPPCFRRSSGDGNWIGEGLAAYQATKRNGGDG